jgi:hypothetical protein
VYVVCPAACLVELDLISGPRSDLISDRHTGGPHSHAASILVSTSMARLFAVWVEMLWPLDEGAAVPLCVRTVDQRAPDGERKSVSCRPAACAPRCLCLRWVMGIW